MIPKETLVPVILLFIIIIITKPLIKRLFLSQSNQMMVNLKLI